MENTIKIAVRNLVEHVFLSGDITSGLNFASRMIEGTRIHQEVQGTFEENSRKEVYVKAEIKYEELTFLIDGRCDGLHFNGDVVTVEEIKSTSISFSELMEDTYPVHWAQALFYAYIYAHDNNHKEMNIQLTYVQKQTAEKVSFYKNKSMSELEHFVMDVIQRYTPFARLMIKNKSLRNQSSQDLIFPFSTYRKGQRNFAAHVYTAIRDEKDIFAEAPTGIGKTISTTFPAVKAMGEGLVDRILYVTARNTTREMAEDAFRAMKKNGLNIRSVTLTAKEKICFKDDCICDPLLCEFAKGHYDRLNDGLIDIMEHETIITRSVIETYAKKHRLCPFEFSIDAAYLADAMICDYNYVFDPKVSLKRLYNEQKKETVLLVDEAHNLVDRARDMFSATIYKSHFLDLKRASAKNSEIYQISKKINDYLLQLKKQLDNQTEKVLKEIPEELLPLILEFGEIAETSLKLQSSENQQLLQDAYFEVQDFSRIAQLFDERFVMYVEVIRSEVTVKLFCLDPSHLLKQMGKSFGSKAYFSATLSPISYFMDMLGGEKEEDMTISIPSPFDSEQTDVFIYPLSTKYKDREQTKSRITDILKNLLMERPGNYFVFFPSYQYMNLVYENFKEDYKEIETIIQTPNMTEDERDAFLSSFIEDKANAFIGFAVMGGIFSEGIDLVGDRLNGVVVVGVGLPQIGLERNIIKDYFSAIGKNGFDYAYIYPGINKVLQAGGRLIRSERDSGTIVLIDDRFLTRKYQQLLPPNWRDFTIVNRH